MAKAKKSKTKKTKAKKSKAKKNRRPAKASARKAKKTAKKSAAAASGGRAAKRKGTQGAAGKTAKRTTKAAAPRKQRQIGEGDYQASRSFLKDQSDFVKRHEGDIPAMGEAAERAMEGPEGKALRGAEEEARSHSKAMGQ